MTFNMDEETLAEIMAMNDAIKSKPESPTALTSENLSETRRGQIDGQTPREEKEEDISVLADMGQGVAYGLAEGLGSMYELGSRAGDFIEEEVVNPLLGTEYDFIEPEKFVNPLDAPKTMAGQFTSGASQLATGFIPGLGILKLGGGVLKATATLGSKSTTLTGSATNLLSTSLGKKAVSATTNSAVKAGLATGIAEQLVFDPKDPRLADLAASTNVPILKDIGNLLKANEGDSETLLRIKMAAEGLGVGVVVEKGISGLTLLGRKVFARSGTSTKSGNMTIDDLEAMATVADLPASPTGELSKVATIKIEETLKKKGYDTDYITKYVGSINLTKIQSSQWETYNLINETGQALKQIAEEKGGSWPPVKGNQKSLEEASALLGHDSVDKMTDVLTQNENMLKITTDSKGTIQLGAGLEGATAYALAARQLLLNQVDVTFSLAKQIKELGPDDMGTKADLKAAYVQQLLAFETMQSTVNGIANESGRLLQSFNVSLGNASKAKFMAEMLESGGKDIDELIEKMSKGDTLDLEARLKTFKDIQMEGGPLQRIKSGIGEYWYNSILSAPDTQVVNILGNLGVQIARTAIEGTIGATRGNLRLLGAKLTGEDIDPSTVMVFGDVWNRIKGMTVGKYSGGQKSRLGTTIEKMGEQGFKHPTVLDALILNIKRGAYKGADGKTSTNVEDVIDNYEGGFEQLYKETKDKIVEDYGASVSNMRKTARLFKDTIKLEVAPDPRYSRYEIGEQASNRAIPTVVGRFVRAPTTAMSAFDTMFKSIADNAALYEAAYRQVRAIRYEINKNGGSYTMQLDDAVDASGKSQSRKTTVTYDEDMFKVPGIGDASPKNLNASEMVEYLVANPTQRMLKDAEQEMLQATFQQQNWATKTGEGFRRLLDKTGFGLGTALMPFVRTPMNLLAYTLERTPLGLLSSEARSNRQALNQLSKVNKNNMTSTEAKRYRELLRREEQIKNQRINKQIVGATYLTGAYFAAQTGMITGGGPTDYTERKRLMASGWRPYSYKIGDTYYPVSRLDPFSQIAGLAADFQFITNELAEAELTPAERKDAGHLVSFVLSRMGKNLITMISDKTYLKSMGEIVDTLYSPRADTQSPLETASAAVAKTGGSVLGGLVPNILSRTAESFADVDENGTKQSNFFYDPTIQDAYIDMSALRLFVIKATSKIPGVRDTIGNMDAEFKFYPRIDEFGSTMDRERTESVLAGTAPADRTIMQRVLGDTFISRPGHREDTADISATLAALNIKEKRTKNYLTIPNTNERIKLKPLVYYNLAMKEGIAYRQSLEELFDSSVYKGLEEKARKDPKSAPVYDKERKSLIEEIKRAVVAKYSAEVLHPSVLAYMEVDDQRVFDAFAKERTQLQKDYFLKHKALEEKLR
jgi:hypothetical protein